MKKKGPKRQKWGKEAYECQNEGNRPSKKFCRQKKIKKCLGSYKSLNPALHLKTRLKVAKWLCFLVINKMLGLKPCRRLNPHVGVWAWGRTLSGRSGPGSTSAWFLCPLFCPYLNHPKLIEFYSWRLSEKKNKLKL